MDYLSLIFLTYNDKNFIILMRTFFQQLISILAIGIASICTSNAQTDGKAFLDYQLTFPRVNNAYKLHHESLKQEIIRKGFQFPANDLYLRSFKAQNELEVWIKNPGVDTYSLFKTYKVCALSGDFGPKRKEGDKQVPEGLYFITNFNPTSEFHLSMLVNYPNYSDRILGHKEMPGSDIYIHGGCVTVGCLPMRDEYIREIYVLCLNARAHGQLNIPLHIFPTRFNAETIGFLNKKFEHDEEKQRFWLNLKSGYDYFERTKKVLPVMYNQKGKYVF